MKFSLSCLLIIIFLNSIRVFLGPLMPGLNGPDLGVLYCIRDGRQETDMNAIFMCVPQVKLLSCELHASFRSRNWRQESIRETKT
jgi:hypothetical protein